MNPPPRSREKIMELYHEAVANMKNQRFAIGKFLTGLTMEERIILAKALTDAAENNDNSDSEKSKTS